jgi:hypothetical protein
MNDAYERRCRTLLRAYPPRHRRVREDELLGTLLDAAEPGRNTPTLRNAWDIVRGGLAFRLRDRPPPHQWLAYRLVDKRLPYRWRSWVRDDVLGRGYFLRHGLSSGVFMTLVLVTTYEFMVLFSGYGFGVIPPSPVIRGCLLGAGLLLVPIRLLLRGQRRRVLAKHEFHIDGTPFGSPEPWQPDAPLQVRR